MYTGHSAHVSYKAPKLLVITCTPEANASSAYAHDVSSNIDGYTNIS